jgi:N-acyl-D-amino-acid deacylase
MEEYDILIRDSSIVDGVTKKEYRGDIGIRKDRIAAVGEAKGDAKRVIEAHGLKALPGFIDSHSHADESLLWYPKCESYVMQGVTTFIGGQCGISPAPYGDLVRLPDIVNQHLFEFEKFKDAPSHVLYPLGEVNEWMRKKWGWEIDYHTMGEYFKRVEKVGFSVNYAPMVGHGSIRSTVMGHNYMRDTTQAERAEMHELIHQAMRDRCIGLSVGMDYDPDVFSSLEEITESVAQIKEYGGIFSPHIRIFGRYGDQSRQVNYAKIDSMLECVSIYEKTGVRLHFAHLDPGWETYPKGTDEIDAAILKSTFDTLTSHRRGELDITWNAIQFNIRGNFSVLPYLCSNFGPFLRELGGRRQFGEWLKVKSFRDEVKEEIRNGKVYLRGPFNPFINPRWAEMVVVLKSKVKNVDGKTLGQIAKERGSDPLDTWLDIIAQDPDTRGVREREANPNTYHLFYTHPCGVLGLDVWLYDDKYKIPYPPYHIAGMNAFSGFPIFLNQFVKKEKAFTLVEAVQKTSVMSARIHRLKDRGVIREGAYADIVLLNWDGLKVNATEVEPRRYPSGIEYVLVNGETVVEKGKHTGAKPGRVLRRTDD